MSVFFGAGVLFGTPQYTAAGVAVTNPSPIQFGILQNITVDESWETKELYGANQFPVAVGRGKGKVSMTAKAANFNAALVNTFLYGVTATANYEAIYNDLTGTAVPTSPYGVTVEPPGTMTASAWLTDLGVVSAVNGVPYTRVGTGTTPTAGQYNIGATGVYTFSSQDYGKTVFISYAYGDTGITSGQKLIVTNQAMGYMPIFSVDLQVQYQGKTLYVRYPKAIASSFTRDYKNDDFSIPEFKIDCFADDSGNISYMWSYE